MSINLMSNWEIGTGPPGKQLSRAHGCAQRSRWTIVSRGTGSPHQKLLSDCLPWAGSVARRATIFPPLRKFSNSFYPRRPLFSSTPSLFPLSFSTSFFLSISRHLNPKCARVTSTSATWTTISIWLWRNDLRAVSVLLVRANNSKEKRSILFTWFFATTISLDLNTLMFYSWIYTIKFLIFIH